MPLNPDELPLWFWLPLAVILWTIVMVTYLRLRRAQRAEERAASSTDVILYCGHEWSLTGAEGPVVNLGRWPILWNCDVCGATLLEEPEPRD